MAASVSGQLPAVSHSGSDQVVSSDLPALPAGYLPFEEFIKEYALGGASTEQINEKTRTLSQTMQSDVVKGLQMLCDADLAVLDGFKRFIPDIKSLAPDLAERMKAGGRIFLVGSGSSGRIAVDIAAKCNKAAPNEQGQIRGVIAGGDSALVRAREGFEDSADEGGKCLKSFNLTAKDTVYLISASGSAWFNVGCGHFAANQGAQVFYFYNNKTIPSRTRELFNRQNNPVIPLEVDIGAPGIAGSTRLGTMDLAECCLGALLGTARLHCEGNVVDADGYPEELLVKMTAAKGLVLKNLETIGQFVKKEADIFLSAGANFRRVWDETTQGYVTVIGKRGSFRITLFDATEASPTFSLNPSERECDTLQRRAEIRAYCVGEKDNQATWEGVLGRAVESEEALADTNQFLLALGASGNHSYDDRPKGVGNFVMGVTKEANNQEELHAILDVLNDVIAEGGEAGIIALSRDKMPPLPSSPMLTLLIDEVPFDHLGIVETLVLKQALNLISNGAMVLAGKVHGNLMVDVKASNYKLINRACELVKVVSKEFQFPMPLSDKELYHYVVCVCALQKSYASSGTYTPSVVKIVLALIFLGKKPVPDQFQEALDFLAAKQETLDFLGGY